MNLVVIKRTALECGRVALAKLGHDPYGMHMRDSRWRDVIRETYRAHCQSFQEVERWRKVDQHLNNILKRPRS